MGHTNSTPNYALPQFVTTDKPAWLTDINGAFSDIDTGLDAAKDAADAAQGDATQALTDAGNAATAAATAGTKADGAIASIADAFSTALTYNEGDYVMYNSLLYVCIAAVTTPGAWTGVTNWDRITIEDIIPLSADVLPITAGSSTMTQSVINTKADAAVITGSVEAHNGININRYQLYKIGDACFLNLNFNTTMVISGVSNIVKLPAGFTTPTGVTFDFVTFHTDGTVYRGKIDGNEVGFNMVPNIPNGTACIVQTAWRTT